MRQGVLSSAALFLLLAASIAGAPGGPAGADVVFTGRVLDAGDGRPLANAQVVLRRTGHAVVSGGDGAYRIVVPAGDVRGRSATLVASLIGYESAEARLRLTGDTIRHDFRLRATALELEELVVTGDVAKAERRALSTTIAPMVQSAAAMPQADFRRRREPWNTEGYDAIAENAFLAAAHNPLSTFSIDVDRASYSNIRRFLMDGQAPPKDAVRIEEMINYFPYDDAEPRAGEPFAITTEVAAAPWRPRHRLVRIALRSQAIDAEDLPPGNLVFLLDVSGSMASPDKLPLVKQSLRLLVNELRAQDRVAIVVYAGAAGLVLPSTPGSDKTTILDAIERLEAGGSTAGGAGIRLAYDVARRHHIRGGNNRVILATDGDFNVGASSDAEMVRLIEEKRRQGTFLTVLGFGTGNLKDSKMEKLADHGNGNYAYIDNLLEARKVLVHELGGTLVTVAKDVKLQVEFNPDRVRAYRLIGYENRLLAAEDFNDDRKDAGELGAGHSVTALYEVVPAGVETDVEIRGIDSLRYRTPPRAAAASDGQELAYVKVRYKAPDADVSRLLERPIVDRDRRPSADFAFAAAVAGFGMLLRDSEHRGNLSVDDVIALARRSLGRDEAGYRAEFVRLAERYREIERGEGRVAGGR